MEQWLTVNDAAETLGVSPRTIRRYIKKGQVEFQTVRGRRRQEYRVEIGSITRLRKRHGSTVSVVTELAAVLNRDTVPKCLYDEIREENKRLVIRVNELEQALDSDSHPNPSKKDKTKDKIISELKQEIMEKENLIQLLESNIMLLRKSNR